MIVRIAAAAVAALALSSAAQAGVVLNAAGSGGLSAQADFTLLTPTSLQVRLRNTSTGVPGGFSNSDQLLTSIGFDLGAAGDNASDPTITAGNVKVGATSLTVNFSVASKGAGEDVSGEWGYSNKAQSGQLVNYVAAMAAGTTPFGGPNLDGPSSLDGPQGGIWAASQPVALGGLGAVKDEVVITVTLSKSVANLNFLNNGVRFEYGSDAYFLNVNIPAPGAAALAGLGLIAGLRRRRR